jgi:hypothetical protein
MEVEDETEDPVGSDDRGDFVLGWYEGDWGK